MRDSFLRFVTAWIDCSYVTQLTDLIDGEGVGKGVELQVAS